VTGDIMGRAPRLRAIVSPTTGLDHIDLGAAAERDIRVFSLAGERTFLRGVHSSAEHTFALLLSLVRYIPAAVESVRRYEWRPDRYRGRELSGKKLGLVGCGRIGVKVAGYARAFGMRVLGYDPHRQPWPRGIERRISLEMLLKNSDVLSIHVPLTDQTTGMIGVRQLHLLPPGAILINTARGRVINERALVEHLERGHLAGAAVDVLSNEPLLKGQRHPLIEYARTHDNLLITPHIAGATHEAVERTDLFVVRRFRDWVMRQGGGVPIHG